MVFDDLLQKALQLHNQGNLDEAEVIYRKILETAPINVSAMHFLAMIAVAKGAFDNAIELLYKAVELEKKSAPIRFNLAMALQGAGFFAESLEQYQAAIKLDKDFAAEGYNNIGNVYKAMGEIKQAEKYYKKAIKEAEDKAFYAFNSLGILYNESGKTEKATQMFEKALQINPECTDAMANIATILRNEGKIKEALLYYEKALKIDDLNPLLWNSYGLALELDAQIAPAIKAYEKAIELKGDFANPYANLGAIYLDLSDWNKAEVFLRKAVELDETNENALLNLGVVLYKTGLYLEAMEMYRKVILINPKNVEVCNNLAIAVHQTGDLTEAAGLCFNAIAINKDFKEVHYTLAAILSDMYAMDKKLALESAKAWVKHCPDNPIAKHTLAAFTKDADYTQASSNYLQEHFDAFASQFNTTLEKLDYKVPFLIAEEVKLLGRGNLKILDLGCGTGLVGQMVRDYAKTLIGIDLSSKMQEIAAETKVYDDLICAEVESFLQNNLNAFDMIVAGDVFCYFGNLEEVLLAAKNALKAKGRLIFSLEKTTESSDKKDFTIYEAGRFKHTRSYLLKALKKVGFQKEMIKISEQNLRMENKAPIAGFIVTATL